MENDVNKSGYSYLIIYIVHSFRTRDEIYTQLLKVTNANFDLDSFHRWTKEFEK